jgi:hypothetical protein
MEICIPGLTNKQMEPVKEKHTYVNSLHSSGCSHLQSTHVMSSFQWQCYACKYYQKSFPKILSEYVCHFVAIAFKWFKLRHRERDVQFQEHEISAWGQMSKCAGTDAKLMNHIGIWFVLTHSPVIYQTLYPLTFKMTCICICECT